MESVIPMGRPRWSPWRNVSLSNWFLLVVPRATSATGSPSSQTCTWSADRMKTGWDSRRKSREPSGPWKAFSTCIAGLTSPQGM